MEEISAFDILIENLEDLGFEPQSNKSNKTFIIPGNERFLNSKYVLCTIADSIYFFASDSFGTVAHSSSTFAGLYSSIKLPFMAEYKVFKKDWVDFIYRKRKKTGIRYIDNSLTILSSDWLPVKELSKENVDLLLGINEMGKPYSLIVADDYLPRLDSLKGEKVIGIETPNWIYRKDDLKTLISMGKTLITNIKMLAD